MAHYRGRWLRRTQARGRAPRRFGESGERGNLILAGHNDLFGEVFKDLEALKAGDEIQVFAGGRLFKYEVRAKRIVLPNDLLVLQPTRESIVTLVTCYPYRIDTHRLVVIGQLIP